MSWGFWLALAGGALVVLWLFATFYALIGALWQGAMGVLADQVADRLRRDAPDGLADE